MVLVGYVQDVLSGLFIVCTFVIRSRHMEFFLPPFFCFFLSLVIFILCGQKRLVPKRKFLGQFKLVIA